MIKPYIWSTSGSWIKISCELPDNAEVKVRPTLRFRKTAICTFTSGQQVIKTPNWGNPSSSPLFEAGHFKATITCSGERYEFGFKDRQEFLTFVTDIEEALKP